VESGEPVAVTLARRLAARAAMARCRLAATRAPQIHGTGGARREYGCL
jgi:hypothetical protein